MEAQRYPMSVRMIGVMHKEKSKMYITSVLWSDQNDIVVYRTLDEFKTMHKQMKKAFPAASKTKKSDRIIPKFQDKKLNQGGQKKGTTKSLVRLKFLQKYCDKLLSCDPQVCQSADLIQFFHPKDQDLQPEFAKNSIMIMPSEDEIKTGAGPGGGGNVTQPFVTETYRCVAPYETKDTKNKPFKVALDEKVDVLIKDKAGWWLVENDDKRMAWFPAPYLEKLDDDDDDDEDDVDGTPERGMLYTAVKSYKRTKDDEITVAIGAVVEVLQKSENGWWLIRYNGKVGYIPTMYLQPYTYPQIRMTGHHQDHRASSPNQFLSLEQQSNQLSLSQGNLLQPPPVRSSSPRQNYIRQRPNSLEIMSEQPSPQPAARTPSPTTRVSISPTTSNQAPMPKIMVQTDGEEERRRGVLRADSEGSFMSDSTDFSDELNSSWASSSSFNLSLNQSYNEDQLRLSRTPPPTVNHLSPTSGLEGRLMPSVSDPNLYKSPSTPKVPPRPRAQEILTRCSTVTRKNAAKGSPSPTQTEITSR
ncbi:NADPH oxidase organizer 1-like [Plectropomus leopardus]|uniref:NADPH oxidase organizer 1-like n=1 Tax=Plectropomus leopardus TaxID=160734 RepID=UPI001C4B2F43|nr:NADPH oxidase organizer 1-like [Plectropomus leopardus]